MMADGRFTYPFCYKPHPDIMAAAQQLIAKIDADPHLRGIFAEGKMLGVMKTDKGFLYAFSGLAAGRPVIEGFVPPIFDTTGVDLRSSSKEQSEQLQRWLFSQYKVNNALGECSTILEIFAEKGLVPPGGTGECAGPKLLQEAYARGLKPLAMGEFWYGASPGSEVRRQGCFYPSCTGKCGPLLGWMMKGLEVDPNPLDDDNLWHLEEPVIHYEDRFVVVAGKPAGMLAVPGRSARKSLAQWLSEQCGCTIYPCHRLDMDTSGLMVFAKDAESQKSLQRQFEERSIAKSYLALLDKAGEGCPKESAGQKGKISIPLASDYYDRPRQRVDYENGKPAVTGYEILKDFPDGTSLVRLIPYTGRTHQLRVHCAHQAGLGRPIAGDRLYGGNPESQRLMLHAAMLSFRHPGTGAKLTFTSERIGL